MRAMLGVDGTKRDCSLITRFVGSVAARYGAHSILELRSEAELTRPRASNERADLVLAFDPGADVTPWHLHTLALARLARRILVVAEPNPERLSIRGESAAGSELAHALWTIGRVREHVYLAVPRLAMAAMRVRGTPAPSEWLSAPAGPSTRWTSRLHAFVVDVTPRTPQARKRLRAS